MRAAARFSKSAPSCSAASAAKSAKRAARAGGGSAAAILAPPCTSRYDRGSASLAAMQRIAGAASGRRPSAAPAKRSYATIRLALLIRSVMPSESSADAAKARVISKIELAFEAVRLEGGVSLHEADAIDNYAGPDERAKARKDDEKTDWRRIPSVDIERMYWVYGFLDAKGFRFQLPATMTWATSVAADPEANLTSLSNMLLTMTRSDSPSAVQELGQLLTEQQIEAAQVFLQWISEIFEGFRDVHSQAEVIEALEVVHGWRLGR